MLISIYLLFMCLVTFEMSKAENCDRFIKSADDMSDENLDMRCTVVRLDREMRYLEFVGRTFLFETPLAYSNINPYCPTYKPKDLSFLKHFPNLKYLTLHGNFATLKCNFESNPNLRDLDMSYTEIECLSNEVFSNLRQLEHLNMHGNRLQELDSNIFAQNVNLMDLAVSANKLLELPEQLFWENVKMKVLSIGYNQIKELPSKIFSNLKDLETIFLDHNLIEVIPDSLLSQNTKLKLLTMGNNKIKFVSEIFFEGLTELELVDFRQNEIRTLGAIFSTNSKLDSAAFMQNQITKISPETFHKNISIASLCAVHENPCTEGQTNNCKNEKCIENWIKAKDALQSGELVLKIEEYGGQIRGRGVDSVHGT